LTSPAATETRPLEPDVEELFGANGWIDPEEFPDDRDAGTWELGPDPHNPEPSAENLAEAAAVFPGMDARRRLDRSDRLTPAELGQLVSIFHDRSHTWAATLAEIRAEP
jgi:hypothetical protein